jgi:hypothetical protein
MVSEIRDVTLPLFTFAEGLPHVGFLLVAYSSIS